MHFCSLGITPYGADPRLRIPMNCPKCQEKLVSEPYRQRKYLLCFYCEGIWLSKSDIEEHGILNTFTKMKDELSHVCPSCAPAKNLSLVAMQGCELEYCESCCGMFFDRGELELFYARYKDLDGKSLAKDTAVAALTLMTIARMASSLFRLMSR